MLEDRITPNNTFTPTTLADDGKADSLRGAINAANADTQLVPNHTDIIQLKAGTYTLNQGELSINAENHNLIIQGQGTTGANATIIDQTLLGRVFLANDENGNAEKVIFKDLVIEGGRAQDDGGTALTGTLGGGILYDGAGGGSVTLSNVVLQSNDAQAQAGLQAQGGGIFMLGGSLSIQNSVIQHNGVFGGAANSTGNGADGAGGGVYGSGAVISISNSVVTNNEVGGGGTSNGNAGSAAGGGVFDQRFENLATSLTITNSNLSDNQVIGAFSLGGGSGGNAEGGGVFATCSTTITDCTLSGNKLTGGNGTLNGSTIGNLGALGINPSVSILGDVGGKAEGGGIWTDGATVITGCNLSSNVLTGGNGTVNNISASFSGDVGGEALGGGAAVFGDLSSTITGSTLSDNNLTGGNGNYTAGTFTGTIGGSVSGGGVYASISGSPTPTLGISDSTLSGNFAFGGNGSLSGSAKINGDGGIPLPGFASGGGASFKAGSVTNIVNSTIAENQAIGGQSSSIIPVAAGGGLFFDSKSSGTLTNVTVVGNQASPSATGQGSTSGGGIDNAGGTVTLVNTLVALNGANKGPDFAGTVTNSDHNLISVADGSIGFSAANGDQLGSELHFLNPHLGQLAFNGGPTQTIALLPGSPAINAGDNNGAVVTGKFDQRGQGFFRISGGTIDIGAFEAQLLSLPPPHGGPSPTPKLPPTLHTPPLLSFLDSLLGEVETGNSNGTWTVTDSLFGIPLLVSTYGSAGNLMIVTLFGIDVTFLFESL